MGTVTEQFWIALSALASAAVAIATWFLARYTHVLAVETRDSLRISRQALEGEQAARNAEERRHMDSLMPHVALEVRDEILELAGAGRRQRFVSLYAKNIGPGFAQNIRSGHLNASDGSQFFTFPLPIALASGERVLIAAKDWNKPTTFMGYSFDYEDAFGRRFKTTIADNVTIGSRYLWEKPH
jgi:hypothetical protein